MTTSHNVGCPHCGGASDPAACSTPRPPNHELRVCSDPACGAYFIVAHGKKAYPLADMKNKESDPVRAVRQ